MTTVPSIIRLNSTTPAAPSGYRNVKPQHDGNFPLDSTSFYSPNVGGVDARTGTSETIGQSSQGKLVTLSNGSAIAVSLDSTAVADFACAIVNVGAGTATLTPSAVGSPPASGTINGASTLELTTGQGVWLFSDGTNWFAVEGISTGGGSSGTPVENEVVSFGTGTTGTLANTPSTTTGLTEVRLYRNGVRQQKGMGNDFTWSGATITISNAALASDVFIADYWK